MLPYIAYMDPMGIYIYIINWIPGEYIPSSYVFFVKRLVFEEATKQNSTDTNDQNILDEFKGIYKRGR